MKCDTNAMYMLYIQLRGLILSTTAISRRQSVRESHRERRTMVRLTPCYDLPTASATAIAPLRPLAAIPFDTRKYMGLLDAAARQLRCAPDELSDLHLLDAQRGAAKRKNRRRTTGSRCNVDALAQLVDAYESFVCGVVAPHVASAYGDQCDTLIFQTAPALRVVPPSSKAAGLRHRDGAYGHQPGQINYWMPLAPAFGNNTLWIETDDAEGGEAARGDVILDHDARSRGRASLQSAQAVPLEGDFGILHRFHGHRLFHFTRPNDTPVTRVSLDFRVVPGPCYDDDWPGSRSPSTGRQSFFLGGFYSRATYDRATGAWHVCREATAGARRLPGNPARRQRTA